LDLEVSWITAKTYKEINHRVTETQRPQRETNFLCVLLKDILKKISFKRNNKKIISCCIEVSSKLRQWLLKVYIVNFNLI
jgi:hypothetical protein